MCLYFALLSVRNSFLLVLKWGNSPRFHFRRRLSPARRAGFGSAVRPFARIGKSAWSAEKLLAFVQSETNVNSRHTCSWMHTRAHPLRFTLPCLCRVVLSLVGCRKPQEQLASSPAWWQAADWMQFWSAKVQAKRFNWFDLCQLCGRRVASESKWNHKICTTKVATNEERRKEEEVQTRKIRKQPGLLRVCVCVSPVCVYFVLSVLGLARRIKAEVKTQPACPVSPLATMCSTRRPQKEAKKKNNKNSNKNNYRQLEICD